MQNILDRFPPASQNNARQIVKSKLIKMRDYPSERRAQELEDKFGVVCDWLDKDYGEPPYGETFSNNQE